MRGYKALDLWQKAHKQFLYIRRHIIPKFPKEERYVLSQQLLKASLSIPLNIAEGCGRNTNKDFANFLDNSMGSSNEVEYCCFAAYEMGYITQSDYETVQTLISDIQAMIAGFLKKLR